MDVAAFANPFGGGLAEARRRHASNAFAAGFLGQSFNIFGDRLSSNTYKRSCIEQQAFSTAMADVVRLGQQAQESSLASHASLQASATSIEARSVAAHSVIFLSDAQGAAYM
eukprot:5845517-Amphidinium_carterae.1